jgi:hypothetical protein
LENATLLKLCLATFGSDVKGFYPRASGIVIDRLFAHDFRWEHRYPSAHASMPWFSVWNDSEEKSKCTGLYIAAHDADATFKEQEFYVDTKTNTVSILLIYPAENCGSSDSIVTANIIQTGAWRIPVQKIAILLFANSSKHKIDNRLEVDLEELGFDPAKIAIVRYNADRTEVKLPIFSKSLKFNPEEVFVLKIKSLSDQ